MDEDPVAQEDPGAGAVVPRAHPVWMLIGPVFTIPVLLALLVATAQGWSLLDDPAACRQAADSPDPVVRFLGVGGLGRHPGPETTAILCRRLREDEAADVRWQAACSLSNVGDRSAAPNLVEALGDPTATVRSRAAWALGNLADPAAVPALRELLRSDREGFVQWNAALSLGFLGDAGGLGVLDKLLREGASGERCEALRSLRTIHSPESRELVRRARSDPDLLVRRVAEAYDEAWEEP